MTEVLSQRSLNRATLARQYLLQRVAVPWIDAIEHLGGMQSQAPLAPYVGLWARLPDFAPSELSALTEQRQVVRLHLMRNTYSRHRSSTARIGCLVSATRGYRSQSLSFSSDCLINGRAVTCSSRSRSAVVS